MKYSFCIGYYDPEYTKTALITNLVRSIVRHSGDADYEFVIVKDGPSYVESFNRALANAKGAYLVVMNDDIEIKDSNWLQKLTQDEGISSWRLGQYHATPQPTTLPDAALYLMSRPVFEKLGLMDERYKDGLNYEDTDYFLTAIKLGIPFFDAEIDIYHKSNQTSGTYFKDRNSELIRINREKFNEKWR